MHARTSARPRLTAPPCEAAGTYTCILSTDEEQFGGHARVRSGGEYPTKQGDWDGRPCYAELYLPSRTGLVYARL